MTASQSPRRFSLRRFASLSALKATLSLVALAATCGLHADSSSTNLKIDLGGGVIMEFVLVPSGSFRMGSDPEIGDADETPSRQITLTRPFLLGRYEVTQEQWLRLMEKNPSRFNGAKLPVDTVSWNDAQRFLTKLAEKTGRALALPTEAQWEYACRAGTTTRWHFGDTDAAMADYGWTEQNAAATTHAIGTKRPNTWGLHDLHGNLGEWCADWYENPYARSDATDPQGPATGTSRVVRGGAWGDHPNNARSAYRNCGGPDVAHDGIGFRCVLLTPDSPDIAPAK